MKRIKKFFSILIGKVTLFLCKLIGRGSSTPGVIAYKFNKNILNDFILPKNIIVVTGSSGKGSTTKMINDVYKDLGFKVSLTSYQIKNNIEKDNPDSTLGLRRFLRTPDFDISRSIW